MKFREDVRGRVNINGAIICPYSERMNSREVNRIITDIREVYDVEIVVLTKDNVLKIKESGLDNYFEQEFNKKKVEKTTRVCEK